MPVKCSQLHTPAILWFKVVSGYSSIKNIHKCLHLNIALASWHTLTILNNHLQKLCVSLSLTHNPPHKSSMILEIILHYLYVPLSGSDWNIVYPKETDPSLLWAQNIDIRQLSSQTYQHSFRWNLFFITQSPNCPLDSVLRASLYQPLPYSGPKWPATVLHHSVSPAQPAGTEFIK